MTDTQADSDKPPELRSAFDAAFLHRRLSTKRGRSHWIDLELLRDSLAGPVWSIVNHGGCAYVYTRDDEYFADVSDPVALRARLKQWHDEMVAGVKKFQPASPTEEADLVSMRQFGLEMWAIAERACDIEQARWDAANS